MHDATHAHGLGLGACEPKVLKAPSQGAPWAKVRRKGG